MEDRSKAAAALLFALLLSVLAGVVVSRRSEIAKMFSSTDGSSSSRPAPPAAGRAAAARVPRDTVSAVVTAREVQILGTDSTRIIELGTSREGGAGIWIGNSRKRGLVALGVHSNGFPAVIVSDRAVRNFGLGRVDGKNASPILVFRRDDIVRSVFGLSMTEPGRPAFRVHYSSDGAKHDAFGSYCGRPDRVCTQ